MGRPLSGYNGIAVSGPQGQMSQLTGRGSFVKRPTNTECVSQASLVPAGQHILEVGYITQGPPPPVEVPP